MNTSKIIAEVEKLAKEFCMDQVGHATLTRPYTMDFYWNWLREGHQASMNYLKEHAEKKEDPKKFWPLAKTALVFTKNYFPHPKPISSRLQSSRVAAYAQGEDYHGWFKGELTRIALALKSLFPEHEFIALTDSSPVLERDLAQRAGLGWFGKNTCLIHPQKGSLFFIGEIYSSLDLQSPIEPIPDFCGTCQRCLEVCPTGALEKPRLLNAAKCISYLTIESREIPAENLRAQIGDWLFGCDLCQTVCPWNQKVFKSQLVSAPLSREAQLEDLRFLLTASGKKLSKEFQGTALLRAGPFGLRRNAIVVATNQKLHELIPEISSWLKDSKLQNLVTWSLDQLTKT